MARATSDTVPHGVQVRFNAQGYHTSTVNRLGHVTTFGYKSTTDTLLTITLPPVGAGKAYQFAYTAGRLDSVIAPAAGPSLRAVKMTVSGGRITSIRDPNLTTVSFGYVAGDTNRVVSRTDRRAVVTSYAFDGGKKLTTSTLNMGTGQAAIVTSTRPAETMGMLPIGAPTAVDTAVVYTLLDGPRTDVGDTTAFWLDRYEEPRRIRNALGYQTLVTRADARWPALVTRMVAPNGQVIAATYDGRGNITSQTDSSNCVFRIVGDVGVHVCATTRFEWDGKWDFARNIVAPESDSTVISYDTTNGNRLWEQDARGPMSRDSFFYYAAGRAAGLLR